MQHDESRLSRRDRRLDLLATHLAGLDPETERARDRLEGQIGGDLATLLVAALSRKSAPVPLARAQLVAVAA
jgi:hypothetical protein